MGAIQPGLPSLLQERQLSELEKRFNKRVRDPKLARLVPVIRALMKFLPLSPMGIGTVEVRSADRITESESDSGETVS